MAGSLPPTSSVWAVSDTAQQTVTFATGMLEAATSDNINPLALRCCEAFGALLPICIETRTKIEQLARRNHTSYVLNFIKAQIGYKKGDSVELLSRSDSGVRFLCLAATLCTLDRFEAANRLDGLLHATVKSGEVCPTIRQLQVLLDAIKTKMILSDFTKTVATCEMFVRSALAECESHFGLGETVVPSKESMQELVLALSEVARLGGLRSIQVKLKPQQVPWTWAFIQWCLGDSPCVRTLSGKQLIAIKASKVTLTILPNSNDEDPKAQNRDVVGTELRVMHQSHLTTFREILFPGEPHSQQWAWTGLVDVRTWVDYRFARLYSCYPEFLKDIELQKATAQALHYIIRFVPEHLLLCSDYNILVKNIRRHGHRLRDYTQARAPKAFPDLATRSAIVKDLLNGHLQLLTSEWNMDLTLSPEELVKVIARTYHRCSLTGHGKLCMGASKCPDDSLLDFIATMGSSLLIFMLFGPLPDAYPWVLIDMKDITPNTHHTLRPLCKRVISRHSDWPTLVGIGWRGLMFGQFEFISCAPTDIFNYAARLLGHRDRYLLTMVSSAAGQVLFPAFFDSRNFMRKGFMQLCAFPGKLTRDGMEFDMLVDGWEPIICSVPEQPESEIESTERKGGGSKRRRETELVQQRDSEAGPDDIGEIAPGIETAEREGKRTRWSEQYGRLGSGVVDFGLYSLHSSVPVQPLAMVSRTFCASGEQRTLGGSSEGGISWLLAVEDGLLRGEVAMDVPVRAWYLMDCFARSCPTPPCQHRANAPAGEVADRFITSTAARTWKTEDGSRVLCDAGRTYAKQLCALAQEPVYPPIVVLVDGCIGCALHLCCELNLGKVIA